MKKQVVFVKRKPQFRIFKQALGLAHSGQFELILVASIYDPDLYRGLFDRYITYGQRPSGSRGVRLWNRVFDRLMPYRDETELAQIIRGLRPYLFHAHAEPNTVPRVVIENATAPVIYDTDDYAGVRYGVDALSPREREAEQFSLESANAIVNKCPDEMLNYYRGLGYKIQCPVLHYMDYCAEELMVPIDVSRSRHDEWHIVYTGDIAPSSLPREKYGYMQYHQLAHILGAQKIHFHIYANPYQFGRKKDLSYRDLERNVRYFHLHRSVPYKSLAREICQYHWGAWIHPPIAERLSQQNWYGIGNKIVSYAEAGLPILINRDIVFGSKLVSENQVGCIFDYAVVDRLKEILDSMDFAKLQRNLIEYRNQYSISNQISRLIEFYEKISAQR